jgi:hypothetical protein
MTLALHQATEMRVVFRVPTSDLVKTARLIARAAEAQDASTLEEVLEYLGNLVHVDALSHASKEAVLWLYASALAEWGLIMQVGKAS